MTTATDIFAKTSFVETRRPTLEASTLPGACHTAEAWYRPEVERIFLREWLLVGRAEQIPTPGDYMTEEIVGETVLLVRGRDARIRAGRRLEAAGNNRRARRLIAASPI
jgi:choline monooxygenase